MSPRYQSHRRGTVLIIAMVVVFAIAAMVLTLGRQVRTEAQAASNDVAAQKADAAERGAEQYVLSLLTDYQTTIPTLTQDAFTAVPVGDAYFWITRPDYNDSTSNPNWGIFDESSKLSLNVATQDQLTAMPGMTDDLAAAIVAYRGNTTNTTNNASNNTSTSSTPTDTTPTGVTDNGDGTIVKNAPFETVEEMMLVQGMTHDLLHGPPGAAANATAGSTDDWYTTHGIADYFTVWDTAPNTAADGTVRISYNDQTNRQALADLITSKLSAAESNAITTAIQPPRRGPPSVIQDMFDFADKSGLTHDEFVALEDYVTNDSTVTTIQGRVNVNTAPREVLLALGTPFTEANVDTLLAARADAIAQNPNSMAWVYDNLKTDSVGLGALICAHGAQYSADITAASGDGRGYRHVRIVVDTSTSPAKIVYRRDLTDHGWPLDASILDGLKHGQAPASANGSATPGGMN